MHILQVFPQIEYSSILRRTCLFFSGFAIKLFVKNELKRYTGQNDHLTPYKSMMHQILNGHCLSLCNLRKENKGLLERCDEFLYAPQINMNLAPGAVFPWR